MTLRQGIYDNILCDLSATPNDSQSRGQLMRIIFDQLT